LGEHFNPRILNGSTKIPDALEKKEQSGLRAASPKQTTDGKTPFTIHNFIFIILFHSKISGPDVLPVQKMESNAKCFKNSSRFIQIEKLRNGL